eukprot:comp22945_c0_seq1/m.36381 comp22945_c0_seq1/g.36381  ORF comp22945_c0_seq1/g.36381 comp22945_c0_seq1/m.36381 type:complete len:534 (-) comp22945_c0_seq1:461-2062(-)
MRKINDALNDYTDIERKVRKATSNKPYAAAGTLLAEIAEATNNSQLYPQVMNMIWKRLNETGKYWRHVFKALILLEYVLKVGSDKIITNVKENMFVLTTLKDFQHVDSFGKDEGVNVRKKAENVIALVSDEKRYKEERTKALEAQRLYKEHQKTLQAEVYRSGSTATAPGVYRSQAHQPLPSAQSAAANEEKARKLKNMEEEQLRLALEMSKVDAEEEQKRRKMMEENDPDLQAAIALSQVDAMFLSAPQADKDLFDLSDYEAPTLPASRTSSQGVSSGKPTPVSDPFGGSDPFATTKPARSDPFGGAGLDLFGAPAMNTPPIVVTSNPPFASQPMGAPYGGVSVMPASNTQAPGGMDDFVSLSKSKPATVTPPAAMPAANPWDRKPVSAALPTPAAPLIPVTPLAPTTAAGAPKPAAGAAPSGGDKYAALSGLVNLDNLVGNQKPASPYSPANPFGLTGAAAHAPPMAPMGSNLGMGGYQPAMQPMGSAGYMGMSPQPNLYAQPNTTGSVSPARSPQMQHQPPQQQNFNPFA